MMLGILLISLTFFVNFSSSEDAVSKAAFQLASLLRQEAISQVLPDRRLLRVGPPTSSTDQNSDKSKVAKGKKPTYEYDYQYQYGYGYGYEDNSKTEVCNFRESCLDYFTILYLTELLYAQSQSDSLLGLNLSVNLLSILNVDVNANILGSNSGLGLYYTFCNMGSCYRSAMDALEFNHELDPYLREDIAMGAKASQLEYIANYLNETQPENNLNHVFRQANEMLTTQLSEQGLIVKNTISSKSKCGGLRYGYINPSPNF